MVIRAVGAAAFALSIGVAQAEPVTSSSSSITYHRVTIDGVGVFYREAGPKDGPTLLLLHGFP